MKYITSIPFTNYATILFSLLINIVMTAIVHNDLNGAFQFYSGLPIGLVFAILLFFYLLVSKRLLFVQLIITALTTSLLFLWVRNVPIDNSIFDALTTSLLLVVSLAICLGIVWITSSSTNLFYNIILIQTLIATLSYTLCFTLQFFYINYIIVFGFIYLYSAYRQQAHRQSGLVSPWILSTLYIFTLAIFIINEVIAESVFSKFLQFYNFRERGELLSNICSNSYSTFQHSLLSAKSYLFSAWEIEGSAPQTNPAPNPLKFPNVSEMRKATSKGSRPAWTAAGSSPSYWRGSNSPSAGLSPVPQKEECSPYTAQEREEESKIVDALPLANAKSALPLSKTWSRRTTPLGTPFHGVNPLTSNSSQHTARSHLLISWALPPVSSLSTYSSSWGLSDNSRRCYTTIPKYTPFSSTGKHIGMIAFHMKYPLDYRIRDSTHEDWVLGKLKNNSTITNIAKGPGHYILVNRRPFYDLIFILTTSRSTPASESTYNNDSLKECRAELKEDNVERIKTVYFSKIPLKQPFMVCPYLDENGEQKNQYLAPVVIISEPEITDKLLAEKFPFKAELNAEIKKLNINHINRSALTTLEGATIDRFDGAYPPTADGDDHIKNIYLKNKTK